MTMQTITSREFNQNPTHAKQAALTGPVQITEQGKVSHVLLSIEQYQAITNTRDSIVDLLLMPDTDGLDFEAPKLDASTIKSADID